MWPYFADNALQPEPSTPLTSAIVRSPEIPSGAEATGANGRPTSIAVTFSGLYTAPSPGWRSFQLDVEGQAALYVDGARKLMRDSSKTDEKRAPINVYLPAGPHELIVRYMTDQPSRRLGVFTGYVDEPLTELVHGLTTRGCR